MRFSQRKEYIHFFHPCIIFDAAFFSVKKYLWKTNSEFTFDLIILFHEPAKLFRSTFRVFEKRRIVAVLLRSISRNSWFLSIFSKPKAPLTDQIRKFFNLHKDSWNSPFILFKVRSENNELVSSSGNWF